MATQSFDIVSEVSLPEVKNAVHQASKEVGQRYDLKGSGSTIELDEKASEIVLTSRDAFTLQAVLGVLQQKLVRREVPMKALGYGKVEPVGGDRARQTVTLQQGIPIDKAREIVKAIKEQKLKKVQAAIQEDVVRVSGPDRDTLQEVIA
ncbi:MAG TPA: YajQ family cyclic di-GMP-binding protein, partial [Thermoanaerobaculia bacterium]|nr:YajQ family cyclic di-GMP-binding protein [Thermoanaerobaculia bacterium]